mgnify:CR=1 FL=1
MVSIAADRPKHNYRNATDLNAMIDDLRPNNEYEFTVKVSKLEKYIKRGREKRDKKESIDDNLA